MAGIETPLATGQPDLNTITTGPPPAIPPAMNPAATAPQNQFQAPAPTSFNIQGGGQFGAQVAAPEYGWQPSQADLGQQQVQQYAFAEGNVPVAQMGLAHGATASRQQALAERQQQNKLAQQKLIEKWDPMGGIGKAADPFQPAFAKATTKDFERLVSDWEQVFGDRGEAYKFLAGGMPGRELEGQQVTQAWSQNWDAIAQANRGYFKRAIDSVAEVDGLKAYLSPEEQKVVRSFVAGATPEGLPVPGTDPQDYMLQGRRIEGILSKAQFVKDFAKEIPNIVQKEAQKLGKAIALPGGNYALEDISVKDMQGAIDFYVDRYAEVAELAGQDKETFRGEMERLFNDEVTRKIELFKREKADGGGSGGGGTAGEGFRYTASMSKVPPSLLEGPSTASGIKPNAEGPTINLFDIVSKRGQTPYARVFTGETGEQVVMHPTRIMDLDGQKYIIGKGTGMTKERALSTDGGGGDQIDLSGSIIETTNPDGTDKTQEQIIQEFTRLPDVAIPYNDQNAALVQGMFGLTPQEADKMFASVGGKKSTSVSSSKKTTTSAIKGLVGKPGYEGYTEKELIDYYKSQGYTVE